MVSKCNVNLYFSNSEAQDFFHLFKDHLNIIYREQGALHVFCTFSYRVLVILFSLNFKCSFLLET